MVDKAFNCLDKDGSGKIDVKDIINIYDVTKNKDYIDKKKTREEILKDFLSNFEGVKGNKDGYITKQEWDDYYTDIATSTPSDEYFVKMMESVWCMGEDEENSIFKDKVRQLIGLMR